MRLSNTAKNNSDNVTGSLSYINTLVNDATSEGKYMIVVDGQYLNESMIEDLSENYGYSISHRNDFMGTNESYTIRWGILETRGPVPTATPTPTPTPAPTSTPVPTATSSAYSYNYSISAIDLVAATGNTITSNNNAVFATTTQDENGSSASRKFTSPGSNYNHWLCSAAGITPTFGYYKDNTLITTGLSSTQTLIGAC